MLMRNAIFLIAFFDPLYFRGQIFLFFLKKKSPGKLVTKKLLKKWCDEKPILKAMRAIFWDKLVFFFFFFLFGLNRAFFLHLYK